MTRVRLAPFLALGGLLASAVTAAAQDKWVEVKSPHFTVVTNASDRSARSLAWQFEQIRSAIQAGWPWARVQLDRPVVVVAAKDEPTMRMLVPRYWETRGGVRPVSVFSTAADRHYIALRADVRLEDMPGINPYFASYWSYSLLTFDAAFERELPLWFRIGLTEVLSNSIVRDDEIQFGRSIPRHVLSLQQARLRLSELVEIDATSPYFSSDATRERFDAQAWGIMHYMLFGRPDDRVDNVNRLAQLLLEGTPSKEALQQVFGSIDTLENAYLQYQKQPITHYSRLKIAGDAVSKNFPVRTLAQADHVAMRAGLHVAMNRPEDARALIAEARKLDPANAASYDVEAILLDGSSQTTEARVAFTRATELNSENFYTYYRQSTFLAPSPANADTNALLERQLRRSIALNDSYSPAHSLLASVLAQGNQPGDALAPALKAIELDPRDTIPRLTLARVIWRLKRLPEARGNARAALSLARNDQQRRQAQDLINALDRAAD